MTLSDRIYIEVNVQHLDEPTATIPLCGTRRTKWLLNLTPDEILQNSRTQRIRRLYREIELLQMNATR